MPGVVLVGPHDHGHGVPADQALDAPLDLAVAGKGRLLVGRDGVDVGRVGRERHLDAARDAPCLRAASAGSGPARALASCSTPSSESSHSLVSSRVLIAIASDCTFRTHGSPPWNKPQLPLIIILTRSPPARLSPRASPALWVGVQTESSDSASRAFATEPCTMPEFLRLRYFARRFGLVCKPKVPTRPASFATEPCTMPDFLAPAVYFLNYNCEAFNYSWGLGLRQQIACACVQARGIRWDLSLRIWGVHGTRD